MFNNDEWIKTFEARNKGWSGCSIWSSGSIYAERHLCAAGDDGQDGYAEVSSPSFPGDADGLAKLEAWCRVRGEEISELLRR